jgi:catabolite regulation protein CreA
MLECQRGAAEYIGDFTTNAAGIGSLKVDAIIAEAFVSTLVSGRVRANLDHLVFWFADPAQAQAACGLTATTPFDGDGTAGPAAMPSQGNTGLELFP